MQDCSEMLFYTVIIDISMVGNNRYIDGRRECEDIRDSREIIYIYIHIYIYIIHLTYLYSYSITTLYHSVVSTNLIVFSMFDCL